jgi:hypothetical protein
MYGLGSQKTINFERVRRGTAAANPHQYWAARGEGVFNILYNFLNNN